MQQILVLCSNYHSEKDTTAFVAELLRQQTGEGVQLHAYVVDCNEGDDLDPRLAALDGLGDGRVRVLNAKGNLGYFGGALYGYRAFVEAHDHPDWVIVSNTDIEFPDTDFFEKISILYPRGVAGSLAPAIWSTLAEKNQNPYMTRRPAARQMKRYTQLFRYYPVFTTYQRLSIVKNKLQGKTSLPLDQTAQTPRPIYAGHGAFVMLHRSYFEAGGTLEHGTFLFGEELFVAETCRALDLQVVYEPRLQIIHREHATTGVVKSRKIARFQWEASVYIYDQFFKN